MLEHKHPFRRTSWYDDRHHKGKQVSYDTWYQGVDWSGFATAAYELALFEDDFSVPLSLSDHYALTKVRSLGFSSTVLWINVCLTHGCARRRKLQLSLLHSA